MPLLIGVVAAMASVSLAIGIASRSGDDAAGVTQTRGVVAGGRPLAPYTGARAGTAIGQRIPYLRGAGFDGHTIELTTDGGVTVPAIRDRRRLSSARPRCCHRPGWRG
jgi:hypothetical protein